MSRSQKLGFILTGLVFLVCGVIMYWLGKANAAINLIYLGPVFMVAGLFWLVIALVFGRKNRQ